MAEGEGGEEVAGERGKGETSLPFGEIVSRKKREKKNRKEDLLFSPQREEGKKRIF